MTGTINVQNNTIANITKQIFYISAKPDYVTKNKSNQEINNNGYNENIKVNIMSE